MPFYLYAEMRDQLFTDSGQRTFLKIRDHVNRLLDIAGAVNLIKAIEGDDSDSWLRFACVDRLIELGEIEEVVNEKVVKGNHRVYVRARPKFPGTQG